MPDWNEAPRFGRREALLRALARLNKLHPGPTCLVETGTIRDENPQACNGDGWSTIAWGWYAQQTGGRAVTVDIDPDAIVLCQCLTAPYASHLTYVCADSLAFFHQWVQEGKGEIHLLYLDSLDYVDQAASEAHHLAEVQAALPALAPVCLVLFDDTHPTSTRNPDGSPHLTGKGARAVPFLLQQGFRLEWCEGGQALLSRGATPPAVREDASMNSSRFSSDASVASHGVNSGKESPLSEIPSDFAAVTRAPFFAEYLQAVLALCPPGGKTCELGNDAGYGAIWLSQQGREAHGLVPDPHRLVRVQQVNNLLGGQATFHVGDPFQLCQKDTSRYTVLHHQGLLEHFPVPWIRALLAQQVALAEWVVFSVPSVYYPFETELADERLLPLEEWQRILAPYNVTELRYSGDPKLGGREHLLVVLRGQAVDDALLARMQVPDEPYPEGISAIVHTRNEARQIAECLETLLGWTDEIIVCDMESTDDTVEIARRFTDKIVPHPHIANFDRARNVSAMRARYRWVYYLDADERIPPGLGPRIRELTATHGQEFEAMQLPFRHYFAGKWLQSLYPGYKAPSLYKNGAFAFNARPHQGAEVNGRIARFPADDPNLAIVHYSYDSLEHYLDKLNRYTSTEAANMHKDGQTFHWQDALRHFVRDFQGYYDTGGLRQDGVHGFAYAFLSGFYRFEQSLKLFERRFQANELQTDETALPVSVEEALEYALAVARENRLDQPQTPSQAISSQPSLRIEPDNSQGAQVVWSGPFASASGYGEESRHFLFALEEAGVPVAAQTVSWQADDTALDDTERECLRALEARPAAPGFVHIVQDFPPRFARHPDAGLVIGRTMFETDRLPPDWVKACNRMDALWVPSEFNRKTFAQAGVDEKKLAVLPGCLDPAPYQQPTEPSPLLNEFTEQDRFVFLSVFDWTLHKGWDVLLSAFLRAFESRDDVVLALKVWSSLGYTHQQIQEQARAYLQNTLDYDLRQDTRIRFLDARLSRNEIIALYRSSNAFVLPSRGEGWGRPYLEAMACGLPTLGTNWSGNTAFMDADNSYLLDYELVDVPEEGWREVPVYRGHRWAEPRGTHLQELLHRVVSERGEAQCKGERAQTYVAEQFSRQRVGKQMVAELARIQEAQRPHPPAVPVAPPRSKKGKGDKKVTLPVAPPVSVRWEGDQFAWHSLALVNRELCLGLLASGRIDLSLVPTESHPFGSDEDPRFARLQQCFHAPLSAPAAVHVRHRFPPRWDPPEEGHFVLIQPWEFGSLPKAWIEPIQQHVSEVWCPSHYVREVYRASGIPEERLVVVPNGVDTRVFHPDAPPYVFTDEPGSERRFLIGQKPFTFLFTGGTLHRKGIDILLDAYLRAFSAYDAVRLVIKDTGTQTVYRGMNQRDTILPLTQDRNRPRIVYLDTDLTPSQLAGLYTASDCLVQPYRGEGFCLPALEAMACGIPVLVTAGGATNDFVDETVGWRLPAERRSCAAQFTGEWECVGEPWWLEVSPDDLAALLRQVVQEREEGCRRGQAGAQRVREQWGWEKAAVLAQQRLEALRERPLPKRVSRPAPQVASPPASVAKSRLASEQMERQHPAQKRSGLPPTSKTTAPSLSLCMIVRNEERVLADCLVSVRPWVEEIILVDTGSEDRTVQIAEGFGAKVFHFPWCDDFSAARNESLRHATGEWILWVDADDTLPVRSGEVIREAIATAPPQIAGFVIPVQFVDDGTSASGTRVDHVKLFRNTPGLAFEGRIHEQILPSLRLTGGEIARLDALVLHSGYDTSPEGQARKRARDAKLLKLDLAERPDHPFVLFNLGMTDHYCGEHASAVGWLRQCLQVSPPTDSHVRKAYALLAVSLRELKKPEESLHALEEGLRVVPDDPELHFHAALALTAKSQCDAAKQHYLQTLQADIDSHFSSVDIGILGFKTYHNLGSVCWLLKDYKEAKTWWLQAIDAAPEFLPSVFELFHAALEEKDFQTAERMLKAVQTAEGTSENWAHMGVQYAEATGGPAKVDSFLRQAVAAHPEAIAPRLVLVRRLLQGARLEEAMRHLHWLNQRDVAEAAYCLGVACIRQGDFRQALAWMERARELNPAHEETLEQIVNLKQALQQGNNPPPDASLLA